MNGATAPSQPAPLRSVASPDEAETLIRHMLDVMDALLGTVEEETELSQMYLADTARIRASQGYLSKSTPTMVDELRKRHEEFRVLLQMNLTVLATAHAVSESIMRGVSGELARKATPAAYGASGRPAAPSASASQPFTLSRVL